MDKIEFVDMLDRNGNPFVQRKIMLNGKHVGYVETLSWGVALITRLPEDQVEMIKKGIVEQLNGSTKSVAIPPEPVPQEDDDDEYEEFA